MARRAAGFADNNMHAEIVNGMNVLAVRDAVLRATKLCREGKGPVFLDVDCYRYWGHSLERSAQRISHQGRGSGVEGD